MNPRAAINDLLPFQGSPFSLLGISPKSVSQLFPIEKQPCRLFFKSCNAEGGIRTHAPLRTNGFQDRLVMTTSIPLHFLLRFLSSAKMILAKKRLTVNIFFYFFAYFFLSSKASKRMPYFISILFYLTYFSVTLFRNAEATIISSGVVILMFS